MAFNLPFDLSGIKLFPTASFEGVNAAGRYQFNAGDPNHYIPDGPSITVPNFMKGFEAYAAAMRNDEAPVNGVDIISTIDKTYALNYGKKYTDPVGHAFSAVENSLFETYKPYAVVQGSVGTAARLVKNNVKEVTFLQVLPHNEANTTEVALAKAKNNDLVEKFSKEIKINLKYVSWTEAASYKNIVENGQKKYIHWGYEGWRMHSLDAVGVGMEFSPEAAQNFNLGMNTIEPTEDPNVARLSYTRNEFVHYTDHWFVPNKKLFRYPGSVFSHVCDQRLVPTNIFNVVTDQFYEGRRSYYHTEKPDLVVGNCGVAVPLIDCVADYKFRENNYVVGMSGKDIVAILKPVLTLSSMQQVIGQMGYKIPQPDPKRFSAFSAHSNTYLNVHFGVVDSKKYKTTVIQAPSMWVPLPDRYRLKFFPLVYRVDADGKRNADGKFYCGEDGFIHQKMYYEKNLNCEVDDDLFVVNENVYYEDSGPNGVATKRYDVASYGLDLVRVPALPPNLTEDKTLTIKSSKSQLLRGLMNAESIEELGKFILVKFKSADHLNQFYTVNKELNSNSSNGTIVWRGDLARYVHFPFPRNKFGCLEIPGTFSTAHRLFIYMDVFAAPCYHEDYTSMLLAAYFDDPANVGDNGETQVRNLRSLTPYMLEVDNKENVEKWELINYPSHVKKDRKIKNFDYASYIVG